MRLYLGSVIINRLPFCRQSGEICLGDAQLYRLIHDDPRHVEVTPARILRQELPRHQAEIQRYSFLFIDRQLRFDQRRQLLANFVKLFKFEVRRQLAGDLFIAQGHLFIAHIQQAVGVGVS